MNIEKLINELSRNFGKALVKKEEDNMQVTNFENNGSSEILRIIIKSLLVKKEYNKAENILFDEIEKDKSEANYKIGLDFYEELLSKNNEDLIENNFSKEEVLQGLIDLKTIYGRK